MSQEQDQNTFGPGGTEQSPETDQATAQLQAELADLMDRLKRVTADYQNYQKRMAREMAAARQFAVAGFAGEILAVVDDLERAMAAGRDSPDIQALLDGVRITHEHLMALLARHGVTAIEAAGTSFDPEVHEAIGQQPTDRFPPGTVLQEVTRGYRMHERVLRPARVIVAAEANDE